METLQRKLIDLSPGVLRIIDRKARSRSMSCKRYIERLVEEDALNGSPDAIVPDDVNDPVLLGLVGIARRRHVDNDADDDRLDYIISKL